MFTVAKGSLFALLAAAGSFGSDPLDGNINVQDTDIRLNELQFLGTHNSYHVAPKSRLLTLYRALESASGSDASVDAWEYTHHTLDYQMQNQNVRHFELDVYYDSVGEKFANPKALALVKDDFRLPAIKTKLEAPGFKVLHVADIDFESNCHALIECLNQIKSWTSQNIAHLPVMVGLELQEDAIPDPLNLGFVEPIEANLQALEDEVLSVFSRDQLITPNLLLKNGETTINAGLKANDWPTLAECRGKIMFTLQGNRITEGNRYPGNLGPLSDRIFFPDSNPDSDNGAYVVRNDPVNSQRDITQLVQDNYLVRTRADADTVEARKGAVDRRTLAIASGAQFVSTDYPQPMSVPNIDFGSGYAVNLLARCNPVTGPANCQVTLLTQAPVTPQNITVPRAPTDGGLGLGDSLSGGIKLDQVLIALAEAIQGNDSSTWTDVENGYVALAYEPSSSAQTMHNMPRIASSSEFNDNSDYIMGLVYIAIPFLVIGLLVLIGVLISWFGCCCSGGAGYRKSVRSGDTHNHQCLKWSYVVLCLLAISGCGLAIAGNLMVANGVDNTNEAFSGVTDLLLEVDSLRPEVRQTADSALRILQDLWSICPEMESVEVNNVIQEGANEVLVVLDNIVEETRDITEVSQGYQDTIAFFNTSQKAAFIVFVIIMVLMIILFSITLWLSPALSKDLGSEDGLRASMSHGCSRGMRWGLLPLSILVVLVSFLVIALAITMSVALADLCDRPDAFIKSRLSTDNLEYLGYYIDDCVGANPNLQLLEEKGVWLVQAEGILALSNLTAETCAPGVRDEYRALFQELNTDVVKGNALLDTAREMVSCRVINGLYNLAVDEGVCSDALDGMILLWIGLLLSTLAMAFAMMVYTRFVVTSVVDVIVFRRSQSQMSLPSEARSANASMTNASMINTASGMQSIGGSADLFRRQASVNDANQSFIKAYGKSISYTPDNTNVRAIDIPEGDGASFQAYGDPAVYQNNIPAAQINHQLYPVGHRLGSVRQFSYTQEVPQRRGSQGMQPPGYGSNPNFLEYSEVDDEYPSTSGVTLVHTELGHGSSVSARSRANSQGALMGGNRG